MSHTSLPNIIRCLVVLKAAWGIHGFRPIFARRLVIVGGAESRSSTNSNMDVFAARLSTSGDALEETETTKLTGFETPSTTTAMETDERPWLGVGPDPMAVLRTATGEVTSTGSGGTKGVDGGRFEEVWLNGPFKAPFPPQPVIRHQQGAVLVANPSYGELYSDRAVSYAAGVYDILYFDDDIVVANKASGLLCVPGRLDKDSLATRVALRLGHYRVDRMIVHRLDMATSGVVIMARSEAALKDLNRQFRDREVRKRYVAVVKGTLPADEGEVDIPLCRNTGCPPLHMVNREHGKPALTLWRVLERGADRTRVEMIPVSGRSHQLRLHMEAIGHPILGDHFYGTEESLAMADRCLLHAHTLCLQHPITGESLRFTAPLPF